MDVYLTVTPNILNRRFQIFSTLGAGCESASECESEAESPSSSSSCFSLPGSCASTPYSLMQHSNGRVVDTGPAALTVGENAALGKVDVVEERSWAALTVLELDPSMMLPLPLRWRPSAAAFRSSRSPHSTKSFSLTSARALAFARRLDTYRSDCRGSEKKGPHTLPPSCPAETPHRPVPQTPSTAPSSPDQILGRLRSSGQISIPSSSDRALDPPGSPDLTRAHHCHFHRFSSRRTQPRRKARQSPPSLEERNPPRAPSLDISRSERAIDALFREASCSLGCSSRP